MVMDFFVRLACEFGLWNALQRFLCVGHFVTDLG